MCIRDRFETVWDYDQTTHLSKDLFVPAEMYGVAKYHYRPGVRALNAVVWTGLNLRRFCLMDTPLIQQALQRCDVITQTAFQIDRYGFKPTGFAVSPEDPSVFFLGDSFTEGLYTAPEATFVSRFGRRMKDQSLPVSYTHLTLPTN